MGIKETIKTVYADKGYDSNRIRELLNKNNCNPIIPYNKRNNDIDFIKELKREERNKINKRMKELMNKQKAFRKKKNQKRKEQFK